MWGEGIAKTIFGESIGSWMSKPSGTRGSGKKRAAASLKLRMAQADLNSATSSLTPAEVAEQDREDAREHEESVEREEESLDLI